MSARRHEMGLPEPQEPISDPPAGDGRADWLCGPEEGIEAELARKDRDGHKLPAPSLFRPGQNAPAEQPGSLRSDPEPGAEDGSARSPVRIGLPLPLLSRPSAPDAPPGPDTPSSRRAPGKVTSDGTTSEFQSGPTMMWEPGANSVPMVRREAAPIAAPEGTREFPMDDADERSRLRHEDFVAAAEAAELTVRTHDVVRPEAFNMEAPAVPWWMQAPHVLRTDRRVQLTIAVVLAALLAITFWPRGPRALSIGEVRRHPDRYNGNSVLLEGKVGEVFPVGGGYAFYMRDRSDTLVVFTRTRTPRTNQHVKIAGTMSTGYLDGQACSALFEDNSPK